MSSQRSKAHSPAKSPLSVSQNVYNRTSVCSIPVLFTSKFSNFLPVVVFQLLVTGRIPSFLLHTAQYQQVPTICLYFIQVYLLVAVSAINFDDLPYYSVPLRINVHIRASVCKNDNKNKIDIKHKNI